MESDFRGNNLSCLVFVSMAMFQQARECVERKRLRGIDLWDLAKKFEGGVKGAFHGYT